MPELPEAETVVRGLAPLVEGRLLRRVEVIHADLLRQGPAAFAEGLEGLRVGALARRGKNVLFRLERAAEPSPAGTLVVNLGMTGRLGPGDRHAKHLGVRFHLDRGTLDYRDVRRFGELFHLSPEAYRAWSARLGPEPLARTFTARRLAEALARSRAPVRSWLLDQRRVAGVGNIYALEALHRARIHPATPGQALEADAVRRLHRSLRAVLREAVRSRGTTIRDYRAADGTPGENARHLRVYGREGEPCPRCRAPVRRLVFGNRSAFYCPRCQNGGRSRVGPGKG